MSDGYYNPLWPSGTPVGTDLRPALMPGWFYQSQQTAPHRISPDEGIDWSWGGTHQGSAMSHMLSSVTMLGDDDDVR